MQSSTILTLTATRRRRSAPGDERPSQPGRALGKWPGVDWLPVIAPEILVPKGYRAVFVAPRAEDETLGLSGLIARLMLVGRPIQLVAATDPAIGIRGQAPSRWTPQQKASEWLPQPLRALRCLSVAARSTVLRPGLQEGELAGLEDDLEWRLRGLIQPSDIVFASWRYDGHADHEAVGRVAARVCSAVFAPLVEVPVWAWHWSFPGDRRLPWPRARRIFLDRALRARKRRAVAEARSRFRPDDGRARSTAVLARATHRDEIVFV